MNTSIIINGLFGMCHVILVVRLISRVIDVLGKGNSSWKMIRHFDMIIDKRIKLRDKDLLYLLDCFLPREEKEEGERPERREGNGTKEKNIKETKQMVKLVEVEELEADQGRKSGRDWIMGILTNKIDKEDLRAGDHIYSWRIAYCYAHHGIYMGDGKVVHFTRAAGQETGTGTVLDKLFVSSSPATGNSCEICGDQSNRQGVLVSCIDCFLAGGELRLFQYSASPALFIAQARGGTCTLAHSDPTEDVLHRANYLLQNGFGSYCIFKNNCEDFAIYCKTGLLVTTNVSVGRSGQIGSLLSAASAVVSSPLRLMTRSFGGLSVMASGMYCVNRYMSDIGVRRDVTKVAVEGLVAQTVVNGASSATANVMA